MRPETALRLLGTTAIRRFTAQLELDAWSTPIAGFTDVEVELWFPYWLQIDEILSRVVMRAAELQPDLRDAVVDELLWTRARVAILLAKLERRLVLRALPCCASPRRATPSAHAQEKYLPFAGGSIRLVAGQAGRGIPGTSSVCRSTGKGRVGAVLTGAAPGALQLLNGGKRP